MTSLDPRSRAAARGWSDLAIRNLFIIPTLLFLIVFNIFLDLFSRILVHRLRHEPQRSLELHRPEELSRPAERRSYLVELHHHAKYVIVSVSGQMLVGFGSRFFSTAVFP